MLREEMDATLAPRLLFDSQGGAFPSGPVPEMPPKHKGGVQGTFRVLSVPLFHRAGKAGTLEEQVYI